MTAERRRACLAASPAVVGLLAIAVGTPFVLLRPTAVDESTLSRKAAADTADRAYDSAALRYQHLMALRPDRPEYAVALADVLDAQGHRSEAMAVLAAVAPADADGYGPAHVRLAEWLIEAHVLGNDGGADVLALARRHLAHPFNDDASRRRADELRQIVAAGAATRQ